MGWKMYTYERKAQYHETDQMGIIHHVNYIKWMEEARIGFLDELGIGYADIEKTGIVSPVVKLNVEYKRPVYFGDCIEVRVSVKNYTGIKLEMAYEFYNKTRDELSAQASSLHCFTKDGRIVCIKKEMPELHEKISL